MGRITLIYVLFMITMISLLAYALLSFMHWLIATLLVIHTIAFTSLPVLENMENGNKF